MKIVAKRNALNFLSCVSSARHKHSHSVEFGYSFIWTSPCIAQSPEFQTSVIFLQAISKVELLCRLSYCNFKKYGNHDWLCYGQPEFHRVKPAASTNNASFPSQEG